MITPKVASWKRSRVDELTDILNSDGVVGIVDVGGVPAGNMLDMRSNLRDSMKITMAKKTLIRLAWENSGRSNEELEDLLIIATNDALEKAESVNESEMKAASAGMIPGM